MRLHALLALGGGLLFAVTASLTAAGDAKDEAIRKDRKRYAGTWQVVSLEVDGNPAGEEDAKKITVVNEADGKWAIEVKAGSVQASELRGLLEFHRRFPAYRPLLVGTATARDAAERVGIPLIEWREFLLRGVSQLGG